MPPLPKVLISANTIDRLKPLEDGAQGILFGHTHDSSTVVLGFAVSSSESKKIERDLIFSIPSGIQICGAFTSGTDPKEAQALLAESTKGLDSTDSPLLFTNVQTDIQVHLLNSGSVSKAAYTTINSSQLAATFAYFHTKAEISIWTDGTQQGIQSSIEDVRKKVLSQDVAFQLPGQKLFLSGATNEKISGQSGITADHRVKDLFDAMPERGCRDYEVVPVVIYTKQTKSFDGENIQCTVPHLRHVRRSFDSTTILLKVDVLALVHRNVKVGSLFSALAKSFAHGLGNVETNLLHQLGIGSKNSISIPETYHFLPAQSSLFISVIYPKGSADVKLKQQRELLHKSFGYSVDQPLFRRSQAYKFHTEESSNGPLLNPHEGLNSGVKDGQASLVKGLYSYHHYMQDRFDDNGWGCAYRSLQTIVSWFRLQGYTEVQVPTHKQIQECLVNMRDKPSSFIGSRQWIGSTEVGLVLGSLLGVECQTLHARSGEEVGSLGSELSYHFQHHGTPIMIGGGVLAHTIIGVDYNRSTGGDIKFLILDPHYTGGEDLKIITGKGWVGWKDIKFWKKDAFYNLCLPKRPFGDC